MQSYSIICVVLSCLLVLSCVQESEARACHYHLAHVRVRTCRGSYCYYVRIRKCHGRKKRDLESDTDKLDFGLGKSLPNEYSFYDLNSDGEITNLEFNTAIQEYLDFDQAFVSFLQTDTNGDGKLDCKEFKEGDFPFSFINERIC